jgi:hypothetical protein
MCREGEMHGQDYRQSSVCEDQVGAPQRGQGSDVGERRALTLKAGRGMPILIPRSAEDISHASQSEPIPSN